MSPLSARKASVQPQTLTGAVTIITGASSGIGAATAWEFAQRGAQVVLAARRAEELEKRASTITLAGYRAVAIPTDVTDNTQVTQLVEQTLATFGRIDILVNNAGIALIDPFQHNSVEEITHILNVNLVGAILLTHAVLPGMLARRHGSIISVASVAAHIPIDPLYCATKFGLRGFSLSLNRDLARTGVSASLVSPGFVSTAMNRHMRLPMPGPEIVARAIANLAIRPRPEVIVPAYYAPIIAAERLLPSLATPIIRWSRRRIIPEH